MKKEKRLNLNSRRGEPFVGLTLARKFIDHEKGYATLHREGFTEEQLSHFRKVSELFGIFSTTEKKFVEHSNSIYMEHICSERFQRLLLI